MQPPRCTILGPLPPNRSLSGPPNKGSVSRRLNGRQVSGKRYDRSNGRNVREFGHIMIADALSQTWHNGLVNVQFPLIWRPMEFARLRICWQCFGIQFVAAAASVGVAGLSCTDSGLA